MFEVSVEIGFVVRDPEPLPAILAAARAIAKALTLQPCLDIVIDAID